ncbi:MAG: hypothetical protein GWP08_06175 [Nitrospiraceae bacterium]|nr:hypothetical protein [Nitrospiraceae bacterium]
MSRKQEPLALRERLRALAAFLPRFEQPGFEPGKWVHPASEEPGVIIMGHYGFSETADAFIRMTYDTGWVLSHFDWGRWAQTPEAAELRDNPDALAQATAEQLARLLTVVIRQERFCEGALAAAFESGLITAICRRAAQLELDQTVENS